MFKFRYLQDTLKSKVNEDIFFRSYVLMSTWSNSDIFKIYLFLIIKSEECPPVHLTYDKAGVIDKDLIFCWLLLIDIYMPLFCIELFIYNT